jgi:hypothetical protein
MPSLHLCSYRGKKSNSSLWVLLLRSTWGSVVVAVKQVEWRSSTRSLLLSVQQATFPRHGHLLFRLRSVLSCKLSLRFTPFLGSSFPRVCRCVYTHTYGFADMQAYESNTSFCNLGLSCFACLGGGGHCLGCLILGPPFLGGVDVFTHVWIYWSAY